MKSDGSLLAGDIGFARARGFYRTMGMRVVRRVFQSKPCATFVCFLLRVANVDYFGAWWPDRMTGARNCVRK
jgi:hypothetical protein